MKRSVFLIILAICTILALASCVDRTSGSTGRTDVTSTSEPDSSRNSVEDNDATNNPTPTAAVLPFTFDLTDEEITETESPLLLIAGMDKAVIIGGEESPYTNKASYYFGYGIYDWNESGYDTRRYHKHCAYSIDRTEIAFCDREDSSMGNLSYYNGRTIQNIASGIEHFVISLSGNAIAYTVRGEDALFMFECEIGESRPICNNIDIYDHHICISPFGDAVAYNNSENSLYVVSGDSDPVLISGDCSPVGISNGGELVYYTKKVKDKWTLFVYKAGKHIQLVGATSTGYSTSDYCNLIFNRDLTQVLVTVNNKLWFSKDGSQAVCVAEITDGMNIRDSSAWSYSDYNLICRSVDPFIRDSNISYLPAKNLCNQLYRFSDTLMYLDSNLDTRYLSSQTPEHGQESSRYGLKIAYMEQSREYEGYDLYYMDDYRESGTEIKVPVEYAEDVVITKNQSIYIENDIGQLFVVYGSNSPILIDTYVDLIGRYEVEGTTYIYYTKENYGEFSDSYGDDLYCLEDLPNSEPQRIAQEIIGAYIDITGIYFYAESTFAGEYDLWYWDISYSTDGTNFTFLCTKEFGV